MQKKRNQPRFRSADKGFTLLELLISITLLVLIVVVAMGAMRIGSRSVAAGEKKLEAQERLRTALSVIDYQIQSQVPLTYEEGGGRKYYFQGDKKNLRFSTNYSIWGGGRGYVVATYGIETTEAGKEVLQVSERIPGLEDQWNTRLIEADGISFEYFHKAPAEEQGKWVEALPAGTVVPERVRLRMTTGTKQLSLEFPVRVFREMGAVQTTADRP
ncbi:MAG: prepilin-type N-terminal cleavage/methylation domain-containing protein [Deltaproteobacteria bacterium]|nr:prepilin-type N-terminal cleavage/methylation domain-containing protein [Deltaproteobacteria bacterium]